MVAFHEVIISSRVYEFFIVWMQELCFTMPWVLRYRKFGFAPIEHRGLRFRVQPTSTLG